jgi:DNA-binding CsgD family transcriptional regulator
MIEDAIEKITQLQLEYDFDKKTSKRELAQSILDAEQQRQEYLYIITIVLVISVAILGFLLFLNQRNKTRQSRLKQKNLELEQKNLNHKLDLNKKKLEFKNKELATNIMYTAEKLQKSKADFKLENRDIIDNVIRQLENASSEESWKEFEVRFQDVHTEFYDNLNKALPDLTPNEKKLCAFLKLNMTTKDISAITHQSVKSITMARYRLRQKLNLDRDENLIAFLSKL